MEACSVMLFSQPSKLMPQPCARGPAWRGFGSNMRRSFSCRILGSDAFPPACAGIELIGRQLLRQRPLRD